MTPPSWLDPADAFPVRLRHDVELGWVHEGARFVVVDKPSGMLSIPGRGPERADCVQARVQARYPEARMVHRLDLETSGLLVVALDRAAQVALNRAFAQRRVHKRYVAVLEGEPPGEEGVIDAPLGWVDRPRMGVVAGGRACRTKWRRIGPCTVELWPHTGRTHQLRVHAAYPADDPLGVGSGGLGHPIVGDTLYGDPNSAPRLLLHAAELAFPDPESGERHGFTCPVPFTT